MFSYLKNLKVFQSIRIEEVPTGHRMLGVTDDTIRHSLADMDPTSAMAAALTEVLCLRQEIGNMIEREKKRR